MNINATLLVEMVIFIGFVLLTMEYVWPPILAILDKRKEIINTGLKNADQAQQCLYEAKEHSDQIINASKKQAQIIVNSAHNEAKQTLARAQEDAKTIRKKADLDNKEALQRQQKEAKLELQNKLGVLCVSICEKALASQPLPKQVESVLLNSLQTQQEQP